MIEMLIYFLGVVEPLHILSIIGTVVFGGAVVIAFLLRGISDPNSSRDEIEIEACNRILKIAKYPALTCLLLAVFTPSPKTLAAMYLVPKVVNNERVENIADDTLTILESLTNKWMKDVTEAKDEQYQEIK